MDKKPLESAEIVSEYEWLTRNGMAPGLACEQLGKSFGALTRMMQRLGRHDLARELDRQEKRWSNR